MMENKYSKLKPCPFCGKNPKIHEGYYGVYISCNYCGCTVKPFGYAHETAEEAIEAWNRRAEK